MRIEGLMLITRRIEECEAFYSTVIGRAADEHGAGWVQFSMPGDQMLSLHTPWHDGMAVEASSQILLLRIASASAETERLTELGIEVSEPHDIPGGVVLSITDPDGRVVQLVERVA